LGQNGHAGRDGQAWDKWIGWAQNGQVRERMDRLRTYWTGWGHTGQAEDRMDRLRMSRLTTEWTSSEQNG